jgi:putative transposase
MARKPTTTAFWVERLPHWEVEGGRYFITIHLAGAIPAPGRRRLAELAAQLRAIETKDAPKWLVLQRAIFREMEKWLDRAPTSAKLLHPEVASMVLEAIEHREQRGDWHLFEYVVMPTHLHLFGEIGKQGLKDTLEDFKRWTGHQASRILAAPDERFWQREWFDHWSRSDEEDEKTVTYMQQNPVKAKLVKKHLDWPYGSWRVRPA